MIVTILPVTQHALIEFLTCCSGILKNQDNVTFKRVRETVIAAEKQRVLHILGMSVALVIQHSKRMHRIISSSVACMSVSYYFTLSGKRHDFVKKCY
jgi:hypothetical protein